MATGFTAIELLAGAAAANIVSSAGKSLTEYRSGDDPKDQAAVQLGIDLWSKHGKGLDAETLRDCT
jgi:hypothetical protein